MAVVNPNIVGVSGNRLLGLQITTGGAQFPTPISATVKHNRWYGANTFECKIGLYGSPYDIAWWGSMDRVDAFPMEITYGVGDPEAGYAGIEWVQMIVGQVDKILLDLTKGTVTCHGRDQTALLIDTYSNRGIPPHTIAEVITELCDDAGIGSDVSGDGTELLASDLYREGQAWLTAGTTFNRSVTYWDLICYLAQRAHCYVFMDNNGTLHVHPDNFDADIWQVTLTPPDDDPPVVILNPSNVEKMVLERDLNVARNTSVLVIGQNAQKKETYAEQDDQSELRGGDKTRSSQHVIPGLEDAAAAKKRANAIYDQQIRHEKKIHWTEPGDLDLSCLEQAQVVGGGTEWHQVYYIESIDRSMSWPGGFVMKCVGTNSDPELASVLEL